MSQLIAIAGPSGQGKSTSIGKDESIGIKGLNPEETFIINVSGKPLPFRGWMKDYPTTGDSIRMVYTEKPAEIVKILEGISQNMPNIKNIIIDDAQYLMAFEFMARSKEKGYEKFGHIARAGYDPIKAAASCRPDLKIFFMYHTEKTDDGTKIKTSGKMIDNHITLEGLFTIVLYTMVVPKVVNGVTQGVNYHFVTKTDGTTTAKSPNGMFTSELIPNDLGYVVEMMDKYNMGE